MSRIVKAPDERRSELVDIAQKLFYTQGYAQTSIKDIVQAAGVAQGTFYYYFDAKKSVLEAIIDKSILKIGFKSTVIEVLYPFLDKLGILWQSGDVNPAQEHFVSNLIRQKIISATNQLPNTFNPKAKKFLLMLPEGEWHEIGLLFSQYLIKESNHQVIYLGQSVPYSDILSTGAAKEFDFILVSSTTIQPDFDFAIFLSDLGGAFPDKKILYFSGVLGDFAESISGNTIRLKELQEFLDLIADL